jgi:hypothetical protein
MMAKVALFVRAGLVTGLLVALASTAAAQVFPERERRAERPMVILGDLPTQSLLEARQNFIERDFEGSAMDLRRAAALLRVDAGRARGDVQRELTSAARNLDRLAAAVEIGRVNRVERLDPFLARAEHASARLYHQLAEDAWRANEPRRAGHALRAAARHLEHAAIYVGAEGVGIARDVTGDAFRISGALVEGVGYVPREVGVAIQRVGSATDRLGQRIHRRPG